MIREKLGAVLMSDWKDRPTLVDNWDESIDYTMAIDENGTTDLEGVRKLFNGNHFELLKASFDKTSYIHERWFTISGVIMERSKFAAFKDSINTVKFSYWNDGLFNYKNGERRVVFHSREIRKREGPFNPKLINYTDFIEDLTAVIKNQDFKIFSSSIDKISHISTYSNPYHVYELCLNFIVERFCIKLNNENKNGILLLEARGKEEDAGILKFLVELLENGNNYHNKKHFKRIKGVYFNPKWCFNKNKGKASFPLLELSDLVSFPIFKYIKTGRKDLAFEAFEQKLHNYPNFHGYGIKKFPR